MSEKTTDFSRSQNIFYWPKKQLGILLWFIVSAVEDDYANFFFGKFEQIWLDLEET